MSDKRKRGRPKKEDQVRDQKIEIKLTKKEYKILEELVEMTDSHSYSSFIRDLLFGYDENMKMYEKLYSYPYTSTFVKHFGEILAMRSSMCEGMFELYEQHHPKVHKRMLLLYDTIMKREREELMRELEDDESGISKWLLKIDEEDEKE